MDREIEQKKEPDTTLSSRAIGGGLWSSTSNWLLKGTTALSLVITLKYLTVYEYGVVQLILSLFSIGVLFNLSAFHDLMVAELGIAKSGSASRLRGLFETFLKAQSLFSVILWALFFFGAPIIHVYLTTLNVEHIRIMSLLFLLSPVREAIQLLFNIELQFKELAMFSVYEQVSRLVALVVGLELLQGRIGAVLWATIISQVVALTLVTPAFLRVYKPLREFVADKISILEILLHQGKWALLVTYVSNLNKNIRVWIIQRLIGTEAVALYSVAANIFGHTRSILPIAEVVTPIIPQYLATRDKLAIIVNKALKYSLMGYVLLGIVAFFFFPPIIKLLFPNYTNSIPLYQIMLLGLLAHSLVIIVTPVFYTFRKQRSLFFAYTRRIILTIIFLPTCVYLFGGVGLAIEFVLTSIIFTLDRYYIARRFFPEMRLSWQNISNYDSYDKVFTLRIKDLLFKKIL